MRGNPGPGAPMMRDSQDSRATMGGPGPAAGPADRAGDHQRRVRAMTNALAIENGLLNVGVLVFVAALIIGAITAGSRR